MAIALECSSCGATFEKGLEMQGRRVPCPQCGAAVFVPRVELCLGMSIGNFILERRLGVGGMGEVWLAKQTSMGRDVALKILNPEFANDEEFVGRFIKEVRVSAQLDHRNIVTAYDAGDASGYKYLAMSFINGRELGDMVKVEKVIPEKDALRYARDIAEALRYAWKSMQLLHRDIKPENIMIPDGGGGAKLMDMGISKSRMEDTSTTMADIVFGTPSYMSPEQSRGAKDIDFRSDIYSLGATLYQMVTGTLPFEASSHMAVLSMHINEPLVPPRERNPKVSEACSMLIERMMRKNPEERQSSWEQVMVDIKKVMKGRNPRATILGVGTAMQGRKLKLSSSRKAGEAEEGTRGDGFDDVKCIAFFSLLLENKLVVGLLISAALLTILALSLLIMAKKKPVPDPPAPLAGVEATTPAEPERHKVEIVSSPEFIEWQKRWMNARQTSENAIKGNSGFDMAISSLEVIAGCSFEELAREAKKEISRVAQAKSVMVEQARRELGEAAEAHGEAGRFAQAFATYNNYQGEFAADIADFQKDGADKYRERARRQVWQHLRGAAKKALEEHGPAEAAKIFTGYTGIFATELAGARKKAADELLAQVKTPEAAPQPVNHEEARNLANQIFTDAAAALIRGERKVGLARLQGEAEKENLAPERERLSQAASMVADLDRVNEFVAEGLKQAVGRPMQLVVDGVREKVVVYDVEGQNFTVSIQGDGVVFRKKLSVAALDTMDRMRLLGAMPPASRSLHTGLLAYGAGRVDTAVKLLGEAGVLGEYLVAEISRISRDREESAKRQERLKVLAAETPKLFAGAVDSFNPETREITVSYNFHAAEQLKDWRVDRIRIAELEPGERSFMEAFVEAAAGTLTLASNDIVAIRHKAVFDRFDSRFSVNLKEQGNGFSFGVEGGGRNLHLVASGFWNQADGHIANFQLEGTDEVRNRQSTIKLDTGVGGTFRFAKETVSMSVGEQTWEPQPFAARNSRPVVLSGNWSRLVISRIAISGVLSESWLDKQIPPPGN